MADNDDTSELGQAIQDVTETASLLIREEIELAKTEVIDKVTKLIKGAVVGIAAGIFAVFGLIYVLQSFAWGIWELIEGDVSGPWIGFLIVAGLLFVGGALAGLIAAKLVKRGSPPVPKMAIEEAQLIKETVTSHSSTPQEQPTEVTR